MKKLILIVSSIALATFPSIVFSQDAAPQTPPEDSAQNGYAGFAVEDDGFYQPIDKLAVSEIIYTGECPGIDIKAKKIVFISDNTPTAPDRRVPISNITRGEIDAESVPYSDREYEKDEVSEDIKVTLGYEHQDKKFAVLEGKNSFKYEIIRIEEEDGQEFEVVLESGDFSTTIEKTTEYKENNGYLVEETNLEGEPTGIVRTQC